MIDSETIALGKLGKTVGVSIGGIAYVWLYDLAQSRADPLHLLTEELNTLLEDVRGPITEKALTHFAFNFPLSQMYLAFDETTRALIGLGSLSITRTLHGHLGRIDDLVVQESFRRRGIGRALCATLLAKAWERKVTRIEAVCTPAQKEAATLLATLQFQQRDKEMLMAHIS